MTDLENTEPSVEASFPQCTSDHIVESLETTNNSLLALEQGVARATASIHRVLQEGRVEQERFWMDMERRENKIRVQGAKERTEREAREMEEANKWPSQQETIPGPGFTSPNEKTAQGPEQGSEALSVPQQETSSIQ